MSPPGRWRAPGADRGLVRSPLTEPASSGFGGRVRAGRDRPLDPGDIVPRAVFPADAPVSSDRLESQGAVQTDARVIGQRYPREGHPEAAGGKPIQQRGVESAAGASTASAGL